MRQILTLLVASLVLFAQPAGAAGWADGSNQLRELKILACPLPLDNVRGDEASGRLLHDDIAAERFLAAIRRAGSLGEPAAEDIDFRLFPGEELEDPPLLLIPTRSARVNLKIDSELADAPRLTFSIDYCW